jgi:septum formation protein
MKEIILASTSPSRKNQLSLLGVPFECVPPKVDENSHKEQFASPKALAMKLSQLKGQSVAADNPNAIVISGDQVCAFDHMVFSKPENHQKAIEQLMTLSGNTHHLHTAISIFSSQGDFHQVITSSMTMKNLKENEVDAYLNFDQSYGCAGAYKIESAGIALFDKIVTEDFSSISGLPMIWLSQQLSQMGIDFWN